MTVIVLLREGVRLWSADGLAATVTGYGQAGVLAVVDGEHQARALTGGWREALACEYCDHAAVVQLRDGQDGDVLCKACAHDQHDRPSLWVRPIPCAVIRRLYTECRPLT